MTQLPKNLLHNIFMLLNLLSLWKLPILCQSSIDVITSKGCLWEKQFWDQRHLEALPNFFAHLENWKYSTTYFTESKGHETCLLSVNMLIALIWFHRMDYLCSINFCEHLSSRNSNHRKKILIHTSSCSSLRHLIIKESFQQYKIHTLGDFRPAIQKFHYSRICKYTGSSML